MEKDTSLTTVKPQNDRLKKLIAYYYFHISDNDKHSESFYFDPNYLHALTIYKGNEVEINVTIKTSKISPSTDNIKLTFLYTVNQKDKYHVHIKRAFYKIGIVFYPLGINHFISQPLDLLMFQIFQSIKLGKSFETIISVI